MRIVAESAHELGLALPTAAQVAQYLSALVGSGRGDEDSAAIYRVIAGMSGQGSD